MLDWNVIVTLHRSFRRGVRLLRRFGGVAQTGLYNVVVMQVPDVGELLARLSELPASDELFQIVSHVVPVQHRFSFATAEELEHQVRTFLSGSMADLAGKRLHVRVKRRGHEGEIHAHALEKKLGGEILDELARRGTPGVFALDDPDVVLSVETVHDSAGMSLWTREDLARYPFLRRSIERGRQALPPAPTPRAPAQMGGGTPG